MKGNEFSVQSARLRAAVYERIRAFFKSRDVLEVETPIMSRGISTDCHLDIFSTFFHPDGFSQTENSTPLFLQTSPELLMKRLLSDGFPDIYQLCKVFRNGEQGRIHNPEFTMLEWYRRDFTMSDFMNEVYALCISVLGKKKSQFIRYENVFSTTTELNPLKSSFDELLSFCKKKGTDPVHCSSKTDLLNFMMSEYVEPAMDQDTLVFVHDFPREQAVFARINPNDHRTALRFELYHKGLELCNGWEELAGADCKEIQSRMELENTLRAQRGKPLLPVNDNFLDAAGMLPACSGAALGVDRLVMVALGVRYIDGVLSFDFKNC